MSALSIHVPTTPRRTPRAGSIVALFALLAAAVLPAHAAAPGTDQFAQASVKETAVAHRVPGTCTPYRCR